MTTSGFGSLDRKTEYLDFVERGSEGKTRKWVVKSLSSGLSLGRVKWWGPWHQFVFEPEPGTVFNKGCLADVESFLADAYADWRQSKQRSA